MSDYLPRDLLVSIFERLQMKEVGRCMAVNKTWYSVISSPTFISQSLNSTYESQILADKNKVVGFDELAFKHLHFYNVSRDCKMVGNVNGLVCLFIELFPCDPVLVLWNPSTEKLFRLPTPNLSFSKPYSHSYGFGFDVSTSDFKVVRMVQSKNVNDDEFTSPLIEVYKLSTGKWNTLSQVELPYRIRWNPFNASVNGNLHWIGYGEEQDAVLGFDLRTEEFPEMILPVSQFVPGIRHRVDVYQGLLILLDLDEGGYVSIWRMDRYGDETSWARIYRHSLLHPFMDLGAPLSGMKYKTLVINRRLAVSVDENSEGVVVFKRRSGVEDSAMKRLKRAWFSCLQRVLPRTRLEVCSFRSADFESFADYSYKGAYVESLALVGRS